MRPDLPHKAPRLGHKQRGFGLVAAIFLIIVIAGVIAAMWRMSATQTVTNNLSLQQARAYQAARAGIEWGISRALTGHCSGLNDPFTPDGFSEQFQVQVFCSESETVELPEELKSVTFYTIISKAEYSLAGSPDYTYRELGVVLEI